MNRRRRAIVMLIAAVGAGLLAVSVVGGYSASVEESYGDLRPVIVLTRGLQPGQKISPGIVKSSFETRRVPSRFVPAGAVEDLGQVVGLEAVGPLPPGSYLTAAGLRQPASNKPRPPKTTRGKHVVELSVAGAGAITGASRVDVLITGEEPKGDGNTRVVAKSVPLLEIGQTGQSEVEPGLTRVTLALTRKQAIQLIDAESFARRITVLPVSGA